MKKSDTFETPEANEAMIAGGARDEPEEKHG